MAGKLNLTLTVTLNSGENKGQKTKKAITLDVYTEYGVKEIDLKKKAAGQSENDSLNDGKAEVTDTLIAKLSFIGDVSRDDENGEKYAYKWYLKTDGEYSEIEGKSGNGSETSLTADQAGEYRVVFKREAGDNRLEYEDHADFKVVQKKIKAEITVDGKNFDNTFVVKNPETAIKVEWKDSKGNTISSDKLAAADKEPKLLVTIDGNSETAANKHFKYASAGNVENSTDVNVALIEGVFSASGINTDQFLFDDNVTINKATIQKVTLTASEAAVLAENKDAVTVGDITYVKPGTDGKASVALKSKTGYTIADKLKDPEMVDNFTDETLTCPVIDGGVVFYAKNGDGGIAKVILDSVKIDSSGPGVAADSKTIVFGNQETAGHSFTITDEEAGVNPDSICVLIKEDDSVASDDESWTSDGIAVKVEKDGTVKTDVKIPFSSYGHVFLLAKDILGNETIQTEYDAVCEKNAPIVTVIAKDAELPSKTKTVSLNAEDTGSPVSGIKEVTLSLKDSNKKEVSADYALSAESEGIEIDGSTVKRSKETPDGIGEIPDLQKLLTEVTISGENLNGTYTLEAVATDYCGNRSTLASSEDENEMLRLVFDNTAPTYTIVLDDKLGSADEKTYYYNGQSGAGLSVTFKDDYLSVNNGADPYTYKVILSDKKNKKIEKTLSNLDNNQTESTLNFSRSEIAGDKNSTSRLEDGVIDVFVTAVDGAGNPADPSSGLLSMVPQKMKVEPEQYGEAKDHTWRVASFVLDTQSPVLIESKTETNPIKEGEPSAPKFDKKNQRFVYPGTFTTTITIEDHNDLSEACVDQSLTGFTGKNIPENAASVQNPTVSGNTITIVYSGNSKGIIEKLQVKAKDLAGNPLVVSDNLHQGTAKPGQDQWKEVPSEDENSSSDGIALTIFGREIENQVPQAVITYPGLDGSRVHGKEAFYNNDFTATVSISNLTSKDAGIDDGIRVHLYKEDEEGNAQEIKEIAFGDEDISNSKIMDGCYYSVMTREENDSSGNKNVTVTFNVEKTTGNTTDGGYLINVDGENQAGYLVQVREISPGGSEVESVPCTAYKPYTMVLDTINPVAALSIALDGDVVNPDRNTEYGNRFYFNKYHTFNATITDKNLSKDLIKVSYDKSAAISYHDIKDITEFEEENKKIEKDENGTYVCANTEEGIIRYRIKGTDLAGNPVMVPEDADHNYLQSANEGEIVTYEIVTDKTAPIFKLTYDDTTEPFNTFYFSSERKASLSFTERTIDHADLIRQMNLSVEKDNVKISSDSDWKEDEKDKTTSKYEKNFEEDGEYTLSIFDQSSLDGENPIGFKDLAGNTCELKVTGKAPFHFFIDKTGPTVSITMGLKNPAEDGKYYYKADNCGIVVTFDDNDRNYATENGKYEYSVTICTPSGETKTEKWEADGTESKEVKEYSKEEIAGLGDGPYRVIVTAKDPAGNAAKAVASDSVGCIWGIQEDDGSLYGEFILDTTSPKAVFSITPSDDVKVKELNNAYGNRYYFSGTHTFEATITEANFSQNLKVYYDYSKEDSYTDVTGINVSDDNRKEIMGKGTYQYSNVDDGIIRYFITGTDLAGNKVVYKEDADKKDLESMKEDGLYSYVVVTDKELPIFTLTYQDSTEPVNTIYFNKDRSAVLTLDERTIDRKTILAEMDMTVKKDGTTVSSGEKWTTTDTESKYVMDFKEDGEYLLSINKEFENDKAKEIKITDLAGNENTLKVTGKAPLHFVLDKKVPNVSVVMGLAKPDEEDGNYYYRKDNCSIHVKFDDNGNQLSIDKGVYEYSIEVSSSSGDVEITKWKASPKKGSTTVEKTYDKKEIQKLPDGVHRIKVIAKDLAGNEATAVTATATELNVKSSGCNFKAKNGNKPAYGEFILDKTSPAVVSIRTSDHRYPVTDNHIYKDTNSVYYNKDVDVTIKVMDSHVTKTQFSGTVVRDSKEINKNIAVNDTKDGVTAVYTLSANHQYSNLKITGQDKAGNPLILKDGYTYLAADELDQRVEETKKGEDKGDKKDKGDRIGIISAQHGKVIDTEPPQIMISYTSDKEANMYEGETKVKGRKSAYYYKPITVSMKFSDNYELDGDKLYAGLEGEETKQSGASGKKSYAVNGSKGTLITKEGRYVYTAYGTDRALNQTKIVEKAPDVKFPVDRNNKPKTYGDTKISAGAFTDSKMRKQNAFQPMYELVLDQTAPTFVMAVSSPSSMNKDLNAQGNRYYFNKDYTAKITVNEINYDPSRMTVKYGQITSGSYNSQAAEVKDYTYTVSHKGRIFTDTESADGVYRYLIYGSDKAGNALVPAENTNLEESQTIDKNSEINKGSSEKTGDISFHIVVDQKKPEGTLNVTSHGNPVYSQDRWGYVTYLEPYRNEKDAQAAIKIEVDKGERSPVNIAYKVESTRAEDKKNVSNTVFKYGNLVKTDQKGQQIFRVIEYVFTDLAGNVNKYTANNRIYLDVEAPKADIFPPTVEIKAHAQKSIGEGRKGQDLYKSNVNLEIKVKDPHGGISSSGVGQVIYQVNVKGGKSESEELKKANNPKPVDKGKSKNPDDQEVQDEFKSSKTVSAEGHNNNDIEVIVTAFDNAGNKGEARYYFGIDKTAPTIEVTYDNNSAMNGEFFKENRIATVAVTERNFDSSKFKITTQGAASISGWSPSNKGGNGDNDVWTAHVTYSRDGNYTLEVGGEDLVGNKADKIEYKGTAPRKFTLDKTAPGVTVTYDNNDVRNEKYYKAVRTATIDVNDVNFGGQNDIMVEASGGGTAPAVNFIGNTASLYFPEDGVYIFNGTVTDKAGNQTTIPVQTEFVIDTKPPVLRFEEGKPFRVEKAKAENLSDHPYNWQFFKEEGFAPVVTVVDTNISTADKDAVFEVFGQKPANRFTGIPVVHPDDNTKFDMGISSVTFKVAEEIDDVYHVRALAIDMAGNESELVEFDFSINRFGSSYAADKEDDPDNVFGYSTYSYIRDSYYHNTTRDLTIYEFNTNAIKKDSQKVEVMKDGNTANVRTLTPGTDYTFEEVPNKGSKLKTYQYKISQSVFEEEGDYSFTLSSEDEAGHKNTTSRVHRGVDEKTGREKLFVDSFPIDFVIDKTPPTNQLAGVKAGTKQSVNDRSLVLDVYPEDSQTAIRKVEIKRWLGDTLGMNIPRSDDAPAQTIIYEYYDEKDNPKPVDTETEKYEDLAAYTDEASDKIMINYELLDNKNWQWVEIVTTDLAGNESEDIRAASGDTGEEIRYSENRRGFLVTTNAFSQIINNMAARIGAAAAIVLLLVILILRKKKKDNQTGKAA